MPLVLQKKRTAIMLNYCFIFTCFVSLPSFISLTFASPVASPSASQSSSGSFPTLNIAVPRPPKRPVCPPDLGPRRGWTKFFVRDCQAAIAKIPRDARPSAPPRNFYLLTSDIVAGAENVQLPLEYESGTSKVLMILSPLEKITSLQREIICCTIPCTRFLLDLWKDYAR